MVIYLDHIFVMQRKVAGMSGYVLDGMFAEPITAKIMIIIDLSECEILNHMN